MSQFVETNTREFECSGAIGQFLRVKPNGGSPNQLTTAGAADLELGTLESASFNAGDFRSVRLRTAAGTAKMIASGAITQYAAVYGDAGGKITATPNANFLGYALNAASGNNSVVEMLRVDTSAAAAGNSIVEAHTAAYAVTTADSGKTFTNTGAGAEVDFTLPAAAVGLQYSFALGAAQTVHVLPNGTDQIGTASTATVPATGVPNTAGHGISAAAIGATVVLQCTKVGLWSVLSSAGTWTDL